MRIDTGQHMRLGQHMKLAPQMIQSMEILQMSQQALEERVEQELASNPTLELAEPGADEQSLAQEAKQKERDDGEHARELVVGREGTDGVADFERLANISEQYGENWTANTAEGVSDFASGRLRNDGERDGKMDAMANAAARGASLFEQLMDQWRMVDAEPAVLELGTALIGMIDAAGYLRPDDDTLLQNAPAGTTAAQLAETIDLMQRTFDPPGLGARDLRECLLLQIDAKLRDDPDADRATLQTERLLVAEHLKDIEQNRFPKIAKATGLSIDQIKHAVHRLRQFHPHPGRLLADDGVRTIRPDAVIDYDEDTDTYTVTLTHGRLPPLQISPGYEDMATDSDADKSTREFVGHHLRNARWLLDAIRQRNSTLQRVIGVVVEHQRDWFEQGDQALKPLPMQTVADQLGIHIATVSRAVSEKYLQTPRGIVPLRMFFSGGTETDAGEAMSWTAVQAKLKEIIDAEDKSQPLSDDQLVEALKKQGLEIARRTVAKYRGQLNIPTARQRKEY